MTSQELMNAHQKLVEWKSELASLEIMDRYLGHEKQRAKRDGSIFFDVFDRELGASGARHPRRGSRTRGMGAVRQAEPVALKKRLDQSLGQALKVTTLADAVKIVFKGAPEVVCVYDPNITPEQHDVELAAGQLTRREALAAVADIFGVTFVLRTYGLYVTTPTRARAYAPAPTIPDLVPRDR